MATALRPWPPLTVFEFMSNRTFSSPPRRPIIWVAWLVLLPLAAAGQPDSGPATAPSVDQAPAGASPRRFDRRFRVPMSGPAQPAAEQASVPTPPPETSPRRFERRFGGPAMSPQREREREQVEFDSDQVKSELQCTDEEWQVIGPKLLYAITLRYLAEGDINPAIPPLGKPNSSSAGKPNYGRIDFIAEARIELEMALVDRNSTEDLIREKLAALRAVRQRARDNFNEAVEDLVPLLTIDQQAILVQLGYLD